MGIFPNEDRPGRGDDKWSVDRQIGKRICRECNPRIPIDRDDGVVIQRKHAHEVTFGANRGRCVDLERGEEYPARAAIERLAVWTAPIRAELGIELAFPEHNGAQRQRRRIEAGATREEIFAASVAETRQTYSEEVTV